MSFREQILSTNGNNKKSMLDLNTFSISVDLVPHKHLRQTYDLGP